MKNDLLTISDRYKQAADILIEESGLVNVLKKYGYIEYEGAYSGNVMMHGDIDIKVIRDSEYTQDDIFIILRDIYDTCDKYFRSLFIKADWDDPRIGQQFPYGRYIGLKTYFNDERWKFDIWFISEKENAKEKTKLDISKVSLTEEQRIKILEFKQFRKDQNIKISGQEIYEAVLEKNFISPELFFNK